MAEWNKHTGTADRGNFSFAKRKHNIRIWPNY